MATPSENDTRNLLPIIGPLQLPPLIFGAAPFTAAYNSAAYLDTDAPRESVKLAFQHGITAIDTSIYYGDSEIVLGKVLKELEPEYPRSSYQIMTKCGRFGLFDFDYSPSRIRQSVLNSLERIQTTYLDAVYLHDVEFVATPVTARTEGDHSVALKDDDEKAKYGLKEGEEDKVWGEGDQKFLQAWNTLRELKEEGIVRNIGISGYPLPTLLRIALLITHTSQHPPDIVLSYSHLSLQNSTFLAFAPHFYNRARVRQLLTASPFSMGLLTDAGPRDWHPAPPKMLACVAEARERVIKSEVGMPDLAMGYAVRHCSGDGGSIPLVVGLSTPSEVEECIRAWKEITESSGQDASERRAKEEQVKEIFARAGYLDWSWSSPPPAYYQ